MWLGRAVRWPSCLVLGVCMARSPRVSCRKVPGGRVLDVVVVSRLCMTDRTGRVCRRSVLTAGGPDLLTLRLGHRLDEQKEVITVV
jgi:hypothetical protein